MVLARSREIVSRPSMMTWSSKETASSTEARNDGLGVVSDEWRRSSCGGSGCRREGCSWQRRESVRRSASRSARLPMSPFLISCRKNRFVCSSSSRSSAARRASCDFVSNASASFRSSSCSRKFAVASRKTGSSDADSSRLSSNRVRIDIVIAPSRDPMYDLNPISLLALSDENTGWLARLATRRNPLFLWHTVASRGTRPGSGSVPYVASRWKYGGRSSEIITANSCSSTCRTRWLIRLST
mmetsp:Transcript_11132/g.35356  ORF Transcript_11132/g.35356 Transcript_11132/m.35356 type:complete len:242 (+) Transcript_11132:1139-1864(+)